MTHEWKGLPVKLAYAKWGEKFFPLFSAFTEIGRWCEITEKWQERRTHANQKTQLALLLVF